MSDNTNFSGALGPSEDDFDRRWEEAEAAKEFTLLPRGVYPCHVLSGGRVKAKTGTSGYEIVFKIIEGEYAGRRLWHRVWFTEAGLPYAKRDLTKLGITAKDHLDKPLPAGIRCSVKVVVRRDDNGDERNEVRGFAVLGIDRIEPDAFDIEDGPELPPI